MLRVVRCKLVSALALTPREYGSQYHFCLYRSQIAWPFAGHRRAERFVCKLAGKSLPNFPAALLHMEKHAILHKPMVVSLCLLEHFLVGLRSARVTVELREPVGFGQYVRRAKCTPPAAHPCVMRASSPLRATRAYSPSKPLAS